MKRYGEEVAIDIQILNDANAGYVRSFHCGAPAIDLYFNSEAESDPTSVTYLFIDKDDDKLIACMTLACSAIFTENDRESFSTILSAMEIKYFAVDDAYQHLPYSEKDKNTLSFFIFNYMLWRMRELSHNTIGASKVVLYAVPKAVHFYQKSKFKEFGDTMYGDEGTYLEGCVPMYYDMN